MAAAKAIHHPEHFWKRLIVLLGLFGVGAVLAGYDFLVARPGVDKAEEEMRELQNKFMVANVDQPQPGPAEVQKLIGFPPSKSERKHKNYLVETYQWRRGLLISFYNLNVVYRGVEKPVLYTFVKNEDPSDDHTPETLMNPAPPAKDAGAKDAPKADKKKEDKKSDDKTEPAKEKPEISN